MQDEAEQDDLNFAETARERLARRIEYAEDFEVAVLAGPKRFDPVEFLAWAKDESQRHHSRDRQATG